MTGIPAMTGMPVITGIPAPGTGSYMLLYIIYMCDAREATGEHHVLAQCAPPVSIFAKYLKPVLPLIITLQESTSIAAGRVV